MHRKKGGLTRILPQLGLVAFLAIASCALSADNSKIDGQKALEHAQAICKNGPRPPGSNALRQAGLYIIEQLKSYGLQVKTRSFSPLTPRGQIEMINIWGVLPGTDPGVILIASHYDSKVFDQFPFVSANDGASSSATVLEIARVLASEKPIPQSIWFAFFDGEEAIEQWTEDDSLYGSREFVRMLREEGSLSQVKAMILLDLIGAKEVQFTKETYSTDWLKSLIWRKASHLGHDNLFPLRNGTPIEDDHLPFIRAGIPAVDIIDLHYSYWHTPQDTPDKLSPENMAIVGNVVLASLPEIASRVSTSSR